MKSTASIHFANIWAGIAAFFLFVGIAIAVAAAIWEPRGLLICLVPFTAAFVAKQGEARLLRSTLASMVGSTRPVDKQ